MSLAKNSFIYLSSNILSASIPFLLLPILTRVLSPTEYGQIAIFQTLVTGLAAFIGLNAVGAANRKYYDGYNHQELSQYNGVCLQILLGSSFFLLIICAIFLKQLSVFLAIPVSWIFSALLFSVFNFLMNLRLGQWQVRGEALKFGILQICNSLFNMGLSLLLVIIFHFGAQGRIDAQIIAGFLTAVFAISMLVKEKQLSFFCWRLDYLKQALKFGVPLVPHVFGVFLLSAVDRFVINKELGLESAGIYMVAVQLSMAFNIVFDAINKAYIPWLFDVLKRDDLFEKRKVVKLTYLYFLLLLFLAPFPFFIGPWALVFIVGEDYRAAGQVIGLLCLGQIFGGMYLMVTNYIFYAKRTGSLSIITISCGVLNMFLLIVLVNQYGIVGAAWAFSISKMLQFLLTWVLASKVIRMCWFKRIL